jgi:hypothetical protein
VNGCFWHQHPDPACPLRSKPRSNTIYWEAKLARNIARDAEQQIALRSSGWRVMVVWECQCGDIVELKDRATAFLGPALPIDHPSRRSIVATSVVGADEELRDVEKSECRKRAIANIRARAWAEPDNYKSDRDEANER